MSGGKTRHEVSAWPHESGIHYQMWRREEGGLLCLPEHPLQVKVELDGCDSDSHCITHHRAREPRGQAARMIAVYNHDCFTYKFKMTPAVSNLAFSGRIPEISLKEQLLALTCERDARLYNRSGPDQRAAKPFECWRNNQILPGSVDISCRAGDTIVISITTITARGRCARRRATAARSALTTATRS